MRFELSFGRDDARSAGHDQQVPPWLHRPELAGAQQVVDQFPGNAQQVSGLIRAVGEPLSVGCRT